MLSVKLGNAWAGDAPCRPSGRERSVTCLGILKVENNEVKNWEVETVGLLSNTK